MKMFKIIVSFETSSETEVVHHAQASSGLDFKYLADILHHHG